MGYSLRGTNLGELTVAGTVLALKSVWALGKTAKGWWDQTADARQAYSSFAESQGLDDSYTKMATVNKVGYITSKTGFCKKANLWCAKKFNVYKDERLNVISTSENWAYVTNQAGQGGYVNRKHLRITDIPVAGSNQGTGSSPNQTDPIQEDCPQGQIYDFQAGRCILDPAGCPPPLEMSYVNGIPVGCVEPIDSASAGEGFPPVLLAIGGVAVALSLLGRK